MKKAIIMALAVGLTMIACEKEIMSDEPDNGAVVTDEHGNVLSAKRFTFTLKGDFSNEWKPTTRGYLEVDGRDLTDVWVLDYVDGVLQQQLHQDDNTSEDFGRPSLALSYGNHHVYFIASRGINPTISTADKTITWEKPSDTFWADYSVTVVNSSNGNRAVTLDRVATKLKVTVNDEVPENCKRLEVTPSVWFYGLDYKTGDAVSSRNQSIGVDIPESMTGTTGQLIMSVFGISGTDEWTTNVSIDARDGDGAAIGHAVITGAPFKRNRATEYSGSLFTAGGSLDVNVNGNWDVATTGTW
jgi:hypothetical protein